MDIKKIITFTDRIEAKLWHGHIDANRYLFSLSILLAAVIGAVAGASSAIKGSSQGSPAIPVVTVYLLVMLSLINVAESIIASDSAWRSVVRSLMAIACIFLGYFLGSAVGTAVVYIVVCVIAIMLFLGALGGSGTSRSRSSLFGGFSPNGEVDGKEAEIREDANGRYAETRDGGYYREEKEEGDWGEGHWHKMR